MFRSLYARLAVVLVALLCLLGGLYVALTLYSTRLYLQEVNQRLGQTLARNLVKEKGLTVREGRYDRQLLKGIFDTYMAVNPSIEVYLVDRRGKILAYSAPPGRVKRTHINLAPVHAFLDHPDRLPVLGDDPRNPDRHKVFSAAPIGPPGDPNGYLYVILSGEQYDSVAKLLQGSFIARLSVGTIAASLVLAAAAGLMLFYLLTRRLRRLDAAMAGFEAGGFQSLRRAPLDTRSRDEVGRLGRTFYAMAQRIDQQVDALRHTDSLRRELVANVSHDLRTPIASLQGYLETLLLKEGTLTAEQRRHYVEVAIRHSERLGKLVAELFELAKLDSGQMQLHREPFPLAELVQDVVMKFQLQAEDREVTLETRVPPDLPFVNADIALIERVLENLLDNALRHTPAGGTVRVALSRMDGGVGVTVADSGTGIPAGDLPHVFDRFYQASKGGQSGGGAVGLGLAITKRILDLHASSITVDSRPETGTRFDFSLSAHPS